MEPCCTSQHSTTPHPRACLEDISTNYSRSYTSKYAISEQNTIGHYPGGCATYFGISPKPKIQTVELETKVTGLHLRYADSTMIRLSESFEPGQTTYQVEQLANTLPPRSTPKSIEITVWSLYVILKSDLQIICWPTTREFTALSCA